MASIKNLKRRIRVLSGTKKIAKAIGLMATIKFQKTIDIIKTHEVYLKNLEDTYNRTFVIPREFCGKILIVFSSDKGLCGSYNQNIFKVLKNSEKEYRKILYIGKKVKDLMKGKDFENLPLSFEGFKIFSDKIYAEYEKGFQIDCLYANYKNFFSQEYGIHTLCDLSKKEEESFLVFKEGELFEKNIEKLYFSWQLYSYFLNGFLTEQSARMQVTESMKKNSDNLVKTLQIKVNKIRQALITKELSEIVGGMI
jgi:F-type H+-transporting ATPase subunit gamma